MMPDCAAKRAEFGCLNHALLPFKSRYRSWHSPSRPNLISYDVNGDIWPRGEWLLGGGQRVKYLCYGLLPRACQAFRTTDTHTAGGRNPWPGIGDDDRPFFPSWYRSHRQREDFFTVQVPAFFTWDVTPAGWSQLSADSHCATPDVKLQDPGCKHFYHVATMNL